MSVLVTSPCIAVRTVGWCGSSLWMKDHLELERVGAGRIADRCPVQNCMLHRTAVADLRRRTRCDLQVRLQSRRYELAHQVCVMLHSFDKGIWSDMVQLTMKSQLCFKAGGRAEQDLRCRQLQDRGSSDSADCALGLSPRQRVALLCA